jgi:hypothetical protein
MWHILLLASANVTRLALSSYVNGAKRQLLVLTLLSKRDCMQVWLEIAFQFGIGSKIPKCRYIGIFKLSISPIPVSKQIPVYRIYPVYRSTLRYWQHKMVSGG